MLNKIIEFSIRNKLIVGLFTLFLILYGCYEATRLPIDAQPDITSNQVQVITVAPSFGAADIERLVTFPVEQVNSNISGIEEIRSFSRFGLSLVTLVFSDDTDVYWARQQVTERLQRIQDQIPEGIGRPELGPISTGLGEIFQYVVRAREGYESKYDETELRTIQDWIVRRQLLGVKGVAEVSSFGGKLKQYEIAVNSNKLQALGLNISDVFRALEQNNQNTGGAYIERAKTVLFIRSEGLIGSVADIENIAVSHAPDGTPVFIRDVAGVKTGFATRYGAMTYNDQGEVSGALVLMLKGANANEVIRNIKERIEIIQQTLPEGVVIEPFLDRAKMVNNTIRTVKINLIEGALIVVFILVVFLGNLRAGFLVASVIPLSMLFAVIMMNLFGVDGTLMSLGALDFGLIVDGAVIIVEAALHQLAKHKKFGPDGRLSRQEMDVQVGRSASRMANSAVFGQIIILIVYLPIFTLEGIEGKMFKPMAQTVAFALIGAFILSLTYIPMMSALLLSRKRKKKAGLSDRAMVKVERIHQGLLVKALSRWKTVLTVVLLLFAGALFTLSRMGGEFIPSLEEGDFAVETRILPGSNINTTIEQTSKAAHLLKSQFPEVEKVVTKIGSAEIPTEPMPMDAGDMIIVLKPKKEWTSASSFPELSAKMSEALSVLPGVTTGFQFPVQMRFNELMTGARQDVVCKIYGEDLDTLVATAEKLGAVINKVSGATDLYIEPVIGVPQVVIDYDRAAIARFQLSIAGVNRIVNTAFAGQIAGLVFEGERRFDLVVRLDTAQRKELQDVRNLLIPTPGGMQVPLHQVAKVDFKNTPNQIQREDTRRRIVVGFNVRGRDVQSTVEELQQKVKSEIRLPAEYHISYGGTFENLNHAKQRLAIAVPVSLMLIFLLLFFAFRSVKQSLLIYTAIPLSAIGGVYLLALRGMPFSISAGVGFIALFGVAVLNGIVLIAEFNRLKQGGLRNAARIVVKGTRTRLRPVLMTASVASFGFLPMALSNGSGAEVQRPLATVVIGGLMLATFLTLFVLPILYVLFEKMKKPVMRFREQKKSMLSICLLLLGTGGFAQEKITLEQALDTAQQNNLGVRSSALLSVYREKMKKTYLDIPQTELSVEAGKINSFSNDTKLGIAQRISFPAVYSRQREMKGAEWEAALLGQHLAEAGLARAVSEVFYRVRVMEEKERLLAGADSLFSSFEQKARLRMERGETNMLELASAGVQREQIASQLRLLRNDKELGILELQLLLNGATRYLPSAASARIPMKGELDADGVKEHPELRISEQEIRIEEAGLSVERSRLLPELMVGYYNQTMAEISSQGFSSVQIGMGIPLFTQGQRARIAAGKVKLSIAKNEYERKKQQLENFFLKAMTAYVANREMVDRYEEEQLPKAAIILQTAREQYDAGEIDYLDWVILTLQAIQLQSSYMDALDRLNQSTIQLNYLIAK